MFTVILPQLLRATDELLPPLDTPYLNRLLRWADFLRHPRFTSQLYARYLGVPRLPENHVLAIPLWQQMGIRSVQMLNGRALDITPDEAQALMDALNGFYGADARFSTLNAHLWQISLPRPPEWTVQSVLDLPAHDEALVAGHAQADGTWLQWSTELQMLLHDLPINQARQARGALPINGVYLYQPDADLLATSCVQAALIGTDSPWRVFARSPVADMPYDLAAWQLLCAEQGVDWTHSALLGEDFVLCAQTGDAQQYADLLAQWDARFFAPLWSALHEKRLNHVCIVCEQGCLSIKPRAKWTFWRTHQVFDGKTLR